MRSLEYAKTVRVSERCPNLERSKVMSNRPEPMTSFEAARLVNIYRKETSKRSRLQLMRLALRIGNLSEGAKAVYRDAIKEDTADGR